MLISPLSLERIPVSILIVVVLPEPFGPIKPTISPLFTVKDRSSTAFKVLLNTFVTLLNFIIISVLYMNVFI